MNSIPKVTFAFCKLSNVNTNFRTLMYIGLRSVVGCLLGIIHSESFENLFSCHYPQGLIQAAPQRCGCALHLCNQRILVFSKSSSYNLKDDLGSLLCVTSTSAASHFGRRKIEDFIMRLAGTKISYSAIYSLKWLFPALLKETGMHSDFHRMQVYMCPLIIYYHLPFSSAEPMS